MPNLCLEIKCELGAPAGLAGVVGAGTVLLLVGGAGRVPFLGGRLYVHPDLVLGRLVGQRVNGLAVLLGDRLVDVLRLRVAKRPQWRRERRWKTGRCLRGLLGRRVQRDHGHFFAQLVQLLVDHSQTLLGQVMASLPVVLRTRFFSITPEIKRKFVL
jgi:hypothetical protein